MIREMTACKIMDLGLVDYAKAYSLQKQCLDGLLGDGPQTLILCEHPPVLTMGRLTDKNNLLVDPAELAKRGVDIRPIDRGGDITLHAPGQLVIYPILNLANFGKDLRRYLHRLEQVAIDLLSDFDIVASRFPGQTGVWAEDKKIASIGIGVRKWISFHGLAVNVNTDLELFSMIRPCGLDVQMTSIAEIKGEAVAMASVKRKMVQCFCKSFQLDQIKDAP